MPTKLTEHPRLYASAENFQRLSAAPGSALLRRASEMVAADAERFAALKEVTYTRNTHNEHLLRARALQTCVVTLLVRYFQTGDDRFRAAALRHLKQMGQWQYWSWITWRQGNSDPQAIYDLSYGENSTTLAIAWDWLRPSLTKDERQDLLAIARKWSFASFLRNTRVDRKGNRRAGWFGKAQSNWNTVCAGGAGMLALAMYDDLPQARKVLPLVEQSIVPYMMEMRKSHGAWPEGIGYWNYGMRYAFLYLLSWENATGRKHPLLRQKATGDTLWFPLDFCPNGVPCSFGDVNNWQPMPFHLEAARKLGMPDLLGQLLSQMGQTLHQHGSWPNTAELLLLHPQQAGAGKPAAPAAPTAPLKLYRGQDWARIADVWPAPKLCLTVRGGTTEVPHGHRDLGSFHLVVDDEAMINNIGIGEYLDTTFSPRRWEIFEATAHSKNVLLIGGVGIVGQSRVATSELEVPAGYGLRLDMTPAMGGMRDGRAAKFYGRVFLLLKKAGAVLVLDHVVLPHSGRVETRLHSYAQVQLGAGQANWQGKRQRLTGSFAASVPTDLVHAIDPLTSPGPQANMVRQRTRTLHTQVTMAALLCPGKQPGQVALRVSGKEITVRGRGPGGPFTVRLNERLRPASR